MAWTYVQRTGVLYAADGEAVGIGYSGFGSAKNLPSAQARVNQGPIPRGNYDILAPVNISGGPHGPFVLPLVPDSTNQMLGRSGFLLHGDSIGHPGEASHGCVIQSLSVRKRVAASGDTRLHVVEDLNT